LTKRNEEENKEEDDEDQQEETSIQYAASPHLQDQIGE
jgi:hypothetical protein